MASTIAAVTTGGGGVITTADSSGNLSLLSGATTVVALTATGATVTGTLAVSGGVTLTTTLPVLQGGTGVTTSTGTGAGVHSVGPSISSAVMTTMASSVITSGTTVASTSGTSIDFTSIPSWVKRITVMFAGLSTNGTSPVRLQIGGGSVETTGYTSTSTVMGIANGISTAGFDRYQTAAADITSGWYVLTLIGANLWVCTAQYALSSASNPGWITGNKTTTSSLDRVRITTVNGTDAFDAGSINILYE